MITSVGKPNKEYYTGHSFPWHFEINLIGPSTIHIFKENKYNEPDEPWYSAPWNGEGGHRSFRYLHSEEFKDWSKECKIIRDRVDAEMESHIRTMHQKLIDIWEPQQKFIDITV